LTTVLAS